jgi:DNA polymerase-3 subunit delta'
MMNSALSLDSFMGNRRAVEILRRAVERDRLPHALMFAGPGGVGKATLAILLAQLVNCPASPRGNACGACPTCRRILAVLQARNLECLTPKGNVRCGACRNCKTVAGQHPDVRFIQPDEKTTISIKQVRAMINEISYQPFEAKYRVVILDPADQMRPEAMNSLLKTLEEPPSQTIIILVTTNPFLLPVTIRSRARTLQFSGIPQEQVERYLREAAGRAPEEARIAAIFGNGSLGSALSFDTEHFRDARTQALRFVSLLLKRRGFAEVSRLALAAARDKEEFQLWIEAVGVVLQDIYYARVAPERIGQRDILEEITRLAEDTPRGAVVSAIAALKRLKSGLPYNLNRQLAVESFFLGELKDREPA